MSEKEPASLQEAIGAWLVQESEKRVKTQGNAVVKRILVDVDVDGQLETVSLSTMNGKLRVATTDGELGGPAVRSVVALLGADLPEVERSPRKKRKKDKERKRRSSQDFRDIMRASRAGEPLPDKLAQVVLALVRSGVKDAQSSATVAEAISNLRDAYGPDMPLVVRRWIGRLRRALAEEDLFLVARLLEGAARAAEDMRDEHPDSLQRERIGLWRPAEDGMMARNRITDRTFIEIGRELVAGLSRASIERRYLMCVRSGQVYVEASARGEGQASVGPTPRRVAVGLAELSGGPQPRRVRLLQYAISNKIAPSEWQEITRRAVQRFEPLHDTYRSAHQQYPGIVEPFFVIAPARANLVGGVVFVDADDFPLPMAQARTPARAEAVKQALALGDLQWVSGRAVDADGSLMLDPCALGFLHNGSMHIYRIT